MKIGSVVEPDPGVERRHDEVVEREGERDHRPGDDRRQDQRQRHVAEGAERRRPEVARGLLQPRIHPDRPRPDDDRHVRDAERDVGERDLPERAVRPEQLGEEDQQADPHDDLGRHHRQEEQRLGRAGAAELQAGEAEAQQRAQDRRADDGEQRPPRA